MNLRQLVERNDRPFASMPQVGRYFPAESVEDARRRLARGIERGDGPGAIIGGAGIGKSLLLQVLAAQFREKFDVVLLACAQLCTRRALLQAIHFELGLDYSRRDEGELRLSLLDTLLAGDQNSQGLLLLVDEAQALAVHLLEELRLLTNLSRGGVPRVRLVMAGLPSLEEKLASPELQSFSQRLTSRCYLAAFSRAETAQYVRAQITLSKVDADRLFAASALDAIFTATDGVPRLVNQLCDRALELADDRHLETIDGMVIQAAWADLQQLPTAWEPPTQSAQQSAVASSNVVEFGSLADPVPARTAPVTYEEPTELDEEAAPVDAVPKPLVTPPPPPPLQPQLVRRPRLTNDPVPKAADPFVEHFEEEELVLDSFLTLASIFGARTPRVENSREPAMSRLVQNALDANEASANRDEITFQPSDFPELVDHTLAVTERPTIRLAVMNDAPVKELPAHAIDEARPPVDDSETPRYRHTAPAVSQGSSAEATDDSIGTILVIEDEPSENDGPQPGVRRENYRQLFARLRHGT